MQCASAKIDEIDDRSRGKTLVHAPEPRGAAHDEACQTAWTPVVADFSIDLANREPKRLMGFSIRV